jgi:hypothetical protein
VGEGAFSRHFERLTFPQIASGTRATMGVTKITFAMLGRKYPAMKCTGILLLLLILTGIRPVSACSCRDNTPSVRSELAEVDAVFTGKFIERSLDGGTATIEVERIWKGVNAPVVTIAAYGNNCGVSFELGQRWLIYADTDGTFYRTGACSRSGLLQEPQIKRDLQELGAGIAPPPQSATPRKNGTGKYLWGGIILVLAGPLRVAVLRRSGKRCLPK